MGLKGRKERCKLHNYNLNKWKKQKQNKKIEITFFSI